MAFDKNTGKKLSGLFDGMMEAVYSTKGASFSLDLLATPKVREFIGAHASVLDSSFRQVEMSDAMRRRLQRSDYIFSGLKTFHELNEAFPSLLDDNGNRKPFERFLNDVRKIDRTYNRNYLRAEYNFAAASAEMAAKWERFAEDGDDYNLQYRTQRDGKVRPEHAALDGVTLPMSDPFWEEYYVPNGWNCRCNVVQVRKSKYPETDHNEAMERGAEALQRDKTGIFRFNSGIESKTFPDYNPYTIQRCRDCDIAKDSSDKFARFVPENELCAACRFIRTCRNPTTVRSVWDYIAELKKETEPIDRTQYPQLQTRQYYQTKGSFKRAVGHARDLEQAEMYSTISDRIPQLSHERFSALGENKDMTDPRDIKNVQAKKKRGVTGYNVYRLDIGTDSWTVTMEVYKDSAETIYHLEKRK